MAERNEELAKRALAALDRAKIDNDGDLEPGHVAADKALCDLLEQLGYGDVVALWRTVGKWYS